MLLAFEPLLQPRGRIFFSSLILIHVICYILFGIEMASGCFAPIFQLE